jgi:hypothetical protein
MMTSSLCPTYSGILNILCWYLDIVKKKCFFFKKKCYLASEDDDDSGTFSHKTKVKNTPGITLISGWSPSPKKK